MFLLRSNELYKHRNFVNEPSFAFGAPVFRFVPHCTLFSFPFSWVHALIAIPCTSGLQGLMHPPKGKRKESATMRDKEREGSTKGNGGLYKKLQIPTLPPKWSRSGVTFHYLSLSLSLSLSLQTFNIFQAQCIL